MRTYHYMIAAGVVLILSALALGVSAQEPSPENPLGEPPTFLRDYYDAWSTSPHADTEAVAFNRWNEDGVIEPECATCHSTTGYRDFLGADGTAHGTIDNEIPTGTVVNCDACHNSVASNLTQVTFPSGVELTNISDSTRCMVCHQGRASAVQVNESIAALNLPDLNTPSADLRFINIHYYAAAASLYGAEAHGGYEFEGKSYDVRFEHVESADTCAECHSPHTLEIQLATCANCHEDIESNEDLRAIRMMGSLVDYDGDGDIEEGIAGEIETLQEILYQTMQQYATDVAGAPMAYSASAYPYFFNDTNGNGTVDEDEAVRENGFAAFTGRLLQAAYNYQVTLKDPGGFAHNAKYHIQLLVDSIEALQGEMGQPTSDPQAQDADGGDEGEEVAQFHRNDAGHFDSSARAFRNWDEQGAVPGTCAKCHTAEGLPMFIANNATIAIEPSSSLECSTCHNNFEEFTVYPFEAVTFPSGAQVSFGEEEPANICLNCHQGRESTVSVNRAITAAGVGDDEVSEALRFRNIHYFAAGATLFGTEVQGAYQYEGQEYNGRFLHDGRFNTCDSCHLVHELEPDVQECADCHEQVEENGAAGIRQIRMTDDDDVELIDYDGDGNDTEPIADEIESFKVALYAAIQQYASETAGTGIAYDAHTHPYWYTDTNSNDTADPEEVNRDNQYASWTPDLLRAAYNYQYISKDPGAFAHNADYVMQVMYDSLMAIGGEEAVASFTRPPVQPVDD